MSNKGNSELHELGMKMREKLVGEHGQQVLERTQSFSPPLARWMVENLFGEVYGDETLDLKTRSLCTLSALIAMGNAEPQVTAHMRGALRIGITKEELCALITQMVWYAGLPAATRAFTVLQRILTEE